MPRTVYMHVGTGKSGTTYLQRILASNREQLKEHGVLYPGTRSSHFLASMDLRTTTFQGYEYPETEGAWGRLVSEARAFRGNVLISHETLGRTRPKVIEKAVGSFPGSDVRVIVTCRDLGRQIPAAWQERVKNRNQQTYADYLSRVFDGWNGGKTSLRNAFWRTQNLIELTRRWSDVVGVENVRLVTVPSSGVGPDELWKRFARAADLPDLDYEIGIAASNASIGTAETELLRRLNPLFPEELTWPLYEGRIKNRFVLRELSQHNVSGRLTVPEKYRESTEQIAAQMIGFLRDSGCTVIGDLEELRPSYRSEASLPEEVSTDELLDLSLRVLAGMASKRSRRRDVSGREAARVLAKKVRDKLHLGR